VSIAAVDASSNRACATCSTVTTVRDVRVPVADVGASSNHVCATCPTVATDEARPLLRGHHSSDRTAVTDRLSVATEGYRPVLHKCIVVVLDFHRGISCLLNLCTLHIYTGRERNNNATHSSLGVCAHSAPLLELLKNVMDLGYTSR
jgi:hypothetical protein